ncbi:MAG: hypothetical protein WDO24_06495 [Pseudomonadota bacterium]
MVEALKDDIGALRCRWCSTISPAPRPRAAARLLDLARFAARRLDLRQAVGALPAVEAAPAMGDLAPIAPRADRGAAGSAAMGQRLARTPTRAAARPAGRGAVAILRHRRRRLADLFAGWVPDAATRRKILVDNPAQLYQF